MLGLFGGWNARRDRSTGLEQSVAALLVAAAMGAVGLSRRAAAATITRTPPILVAAGNFKRGHQASTFTVGNAILFSGNVRNHVVFLQKTTHNEISRGLGPWRRFSNPSISRGELTIDTKIHHFENTCLFLLPPQFGWPSRDGSIVNAPTITVLSNSFHGNKAERFGNSLADYKILCPGKRKRVLEPRPPLSSQCAQQQRSGFQHP